MHAKITAYKKFLICELLATKSVENEVCTSLDNPGNFGQVIMQTDKHLGVSPEALILLSRVKRGTDSLGDVDWFSTQVPDMPVSHAFSWIGGPHSIKNASECIASRQFVLGGYVPIENTVPEGAKTHIDLVTKT